MARVDGTSYDEAVGNFAKKIGRSAHTVYSWLSQHRDKPGSSRPIPTHHYDRLVETGVVDPLIMDPSTETDSDLK